MLRGLYHSLVMAHPPAFRRRFAAEMLLIFDDAQQWSGPRTLFLDAILSLARQWLLRSGSWKVAAAVAGAFIEVMAGGLIWIVLGH